MFGIDRSLVGLLGSAMLAMSMAGCISLNYGDLDDPDVTPPPDALFGSDAGPDAGSDATTHPVPRGENAFEGFDPLEEAVEPTLGWSDLTRLARDHRRRGEWAEAEQRLDQAATLLSSLPPTHARRRTVFGMQARLAEMMASRGELDRSDTLADRLIRMAEAEPQIGGSALNALALAVADRRSGAMAGGDDAWIPRLRVLDIALRSAQSGTANRERMNMASRIAAEALYADELDLARRAVDQAIADARILAPSKLNQIAWLSIQRAQIAAAQNDFVLAEEDAIRSNQLFEKIAADDGHRGFGEATLAEILAKKGETDRALTIALAARARLDAQAQIAHHARRVILGALARVERAHGDLEDARQHYRQALEVPRQDTNSDRFLVRNLRTEYSEL